MHEEIRTVFAGRHAIQGDVELEEHFAVMRARGELDAAELLESAQLLAAALSTVRST